MIQELLHHGLRACAQLGMQSLVEVDLQSLDVYRNRVLAFSRAMGEVECQVVNDGARWLQPEIEAEHLGVRKQRHNPAITGERCTVGVFFAQGLAPTPDDVPEALSIAPYPADLVGKASAFWKAEVGRLLAGGIFGCDLVEQIVRDQATFGAYRHVAHQALPPGSRT
jgi:hypothetical protein